MDVGGGRPGEGCTGGGRFFVWGLQRRMVELVVFPPFVTLITGVGLRACSWAVMLLGVCSW